MSRMKMPLFAVLLLASFLAGTANAEEKSPRDKGFCEMFRIVCDIIEAL